MVAVAGPTGSGKSDLALLIAEKFDGEIVNCDSLQVYRHFDIGTAKLPPAERRGIPHHLIDILDPDRTLHGRRICAPGARQRSPEISARGRLPIVAGGTGFYLRALLDGLFEGPSAISHCATAWPRAKPAAPGSLHRLLKTIGFQPRRAKIHANDVPKVTRALEVCLLTRRRSANCSSRGATRFRVIAR